MCSTIDRLASLALGLILVTTPARAQAPRALTLGDAARLAAERAPSAVASRERAAEGGARVVQARAAYLPSLTTEAVMDGGSEQAGMLTGAPGASPLDPTRDVNFRVQATQRLFDLSSLRRWRAAASEADATASTAVAAGEQAAERGSLAYLRVLRAEARVAARLADSTLSAELLGIARRQLEAGTAIALDVTRAESQLAGNVSALIADRSDLARARLELLHALALPLGTPLELRDSLRAPAPGDGALSEAEAVRTALLHRGDVLAAAAWSEAARREVGAIRAERLPTVSFFTTAASSREGALDAQRYGISVSLPLFDGFRREARVSEARARERASNAEWEDLRLRVEVDVRSALLDLGAAREQVTAANVQLRLAEQEVAQAGERFRAGLDDNSDVITAALALNRARDQVVDALSAYHVARVALASAQGRTTALE